MKKVTIEGYEFHELSESCQNRIVEKFRDDFSSDNWWQESIIEHWKKYLSERGFDNPTISYSQSDGAYFSCNNVNTKKFIESFDEENRFGSIKTFVPYDIQIKTESRYHLNYRAMNISSDWGNYSEPEETQDLFYDLDRFILWQAQEFAKLIYEELESEYEYQISDENILSYIEDNQMLFNSLGGGIEEWMILEVDDDYCGTN